MKKLLCASVGELAEFGDVCSRKLGQWIWNDINRFLVDDILHHVNIEIEETKQIQDNIFNGKVIVITGSFDKYKRTDIKDILESMGAKIGSSVSSKTNYVVYGEKAGSKLAAAKKLNTPVMTMHGDVDDLETRFMSVGII